jgi:hypothetical protein
LRQQVVTEIRSNQRLESDLNQMDIKIGLLVKNRITLQVCQPGSFERPPDEGLHFSGCNLPSSYFEEIS